MLQDGTFLQNEITEANLKQLLRREGRLSESRICELYDLACEAADAARTLVGEGYGVYEVLEILGEGISLTGTPPHSDALDENLPRISSAITSAVRQDKVTFSELLSNVLSACNIALAEGDFLYDGGGEETFTYVKNKLADEAYDVFSQEFIDPRVFYAASFKEAARAVADGDAEYCLLPLEERGGARIPSIASILFKEDLKINSVTPVFGLDGYADMKYALVSRHFTVPEISGEDDRYLELRFVLDSVSLAEIFSAAEQLGVTVYRANTVVFETEEGDAPCLTVVFKKNGGDFVTLLTYLTLFFPSYTAVGIYCNLE